MKIQGRRGPTCSCLKPLVSCFLSSPCASINAVEFVGGSHGDGVVWLFARINAHGTVVAKDCFWHLFAITSLTNTHSYNTPTPPNSTHSPLPKPPSLPPINSPHPRQLSLLIPRPNHGSQPPPRPHPNPSAHASKPYTASPCHHRADGTSTRTPARVRSWCPVPPLVRAVVSVEVSCNSEMSMRTDCRGHFGGAVRCQDEGEGCWEKICRGRRLLNRSTPPRGC